MIRGKKVSQAGDVLFLTDPHHLAQQKPPAKGNQGWSKVNWQIVQPGGRGFADAAVKGPAGAVTSD